jgi:hypothetical protein
LLRRVQYNLNLQPARRDTSQRRGLPVRRAVPDWLLPQASRCSPPIPHGASCSGGDAYYHCVAGDICYYAAAPTSDLICGQPIPVGPGDPCGTATGSPTVCTHGTYCNGNGICSAVGSTPNAEPCLSFLDCQPGLTCLANSTVSAGGQCGAPLASGASCKGYLDCVPGYACDFYPGGTNTCVPITFGSIGDACQTPLSQCATGFCHYGDPDGGATCVAVIPDNGACTLGDFSTSCDDYAACVNGTCQLDPAACK